MSSIAARIHACVWGLTHEDYPPLCPSRSPDHLTSFLDHLEQASTWDVLGLADLVLPPFRSASASTSSARQSVASQRIPSHRSLKVVVEDSEWVEDVEILARRKWNISPDSPLVLSHSEWPEVRRCLAFASKSFPHQFSRTGDGGSLAVFEEEWEAHTDTRAKQEPMIMDFLLQLVVPQPITSTFMLYEQYRIVGGGTGIGIEFIEVMNAPKRRNLVRVENQTILVQMAHAVALQSVIGVPRQRETWNATAEDIYTQAFTASLAVSQSRSPSKVVFMGNPGLYRAAYTIHETLVVSKWYSTNPLQATTFLGSAIEVHQGHLLRQKMALTAVEDDDWFEDRESHRSSPSRLAMATDIIIGAVHSAVDIFIRLGEVLFSYPTIDLDLHGPLVHVRCLRASQEFLDASRSMKRFECIKDGEIWRNPEWFIKIPSGVNEIAATREVSSKTDVIDVGAELLVTTGEHKGKLLLATRAGGDPVGGSALDPFDEIDEIDKNDLLTKIRAIHAAGWHHHDLHPGNVVVSASKITIVDYGEAQRASECLLSEYCCADEDVITSLTTISPSSSTGTALESALSESTMTLVGEEGNTGDVVSSVPASNMEEENGGALSELDKK
ncbi:hypothetical protein BDZ89DRAFT_1132168 [Hymenopellis radicata]|nr:hypothetical protein BDZ89DRAFT_1132168 [Hymenopellis radicata]